MVGNASFLKLFIFPVTFFILVSFLISCGGYYKVITYNTEEEFNRELNHNLHRKDVIVHVRSRTIMLININIEGLLVSGTISPTRKGYEQRKEQIYKPKKTKLTDAKFSKREVHLFINEDYIKEDLVFGEDIKFHINDINEMRLYKLDDYTFATVIFTSLGIAATMFLVALATKESCPFIYSFDGKEYHLEGEIFSGAIFKPLERKDYLKLPHLKPHDGAYRLAITNELQEIQYINHVSLIVAEAPAGFEVFLDKNGQAYTVVEKRTPIESTDIEGNSIDVISITNDNKYYNFDHDGYDKNQINLVFEKPDNAREMKLILKAKSSAWVDYLWREYARLSGPDYQAFINIRNNLPAENLNNWKVNAELPLSVHLKQDQEWKCINRIEHTGPIAFREILVPIDISKTKNNTIEIRLTTGYRFWDVDYIYADFSKNYPVAISRPECLEANNQDNVSYKPLIENDDQEYLIQYTTEDELMINYQVTPIKEGIKQTYFLQSKGYYQHIRNFKEKPINSINNKDLLKPEFFLGYSRKHFYRVMNERVSQ